MTRENFISKIAPLVVKHAPKYNILCPSAIISQALLESDGGTSELAVNAYNYFGLKYRVGRCPTAIGIYYKNGAEQDPITGAYTNSAMQWMKFPDMEQGVIGYLDFINISNYKSLKGVTNPRIYLENIKKAGYATSIKYVENCLNIIEKYNLTRYDNVTSIKNNETKNNNTGGNKMRISVHAGHNPDGKPACGAIGLVKESTETRIIKDKVIKMLKEQGHTVYDDTVDNGVSANDVLKKIVSKVNSRYIDLSVSIHLNADTKKISDKITTGTEVFVYSNTSKAYPYAQKVVNAIASLGFKNRGVKTSKNLYVLKNTIAPSMLIECFFVDDPDDVELYNSDKMAQAIVKGITGVTPVITQTPTINTSFKEYYRVQTGAYSVEKNAIELKNKLQKNGFDAIVKKIDNLYKVQVGVYSKKENAETMLKKLNSKGFNAFITES